MAKIEILESAQRELEAIAELHMNLVGPNSARKITDRILDSLSRLERFPLSGSLPRDAELLKSGYRYVIAGQYLCVYRLIVDTVFVYHIVHGASNYPERRLTQSALPDKAERCCCFCVGLSFASGLTDGSRPVSTNPQQSRKPRRYRHYRWGFLLLGDTMDTHQFTFATLLCAAQVQKSHRLPRDEMQAERPFYRIFDNLP